MAHHTPLLRKLKDVEMQYQHNKITNLKLAVARLDGIVVQPGETLSYCLGYAIDDAFPLEEAWLSTVPQGIPGTYIPLGTAELK